MGPQQPSPHKGLFHDGTTMCPKAAAFHSSVTWAPALATQPGDLSPSPEAMLPILRVVYSDPFVASKKVWSRHKWYIFHAGQQGEAGEQGPTWQVTQVRHTPQFTGGKT